MSVIAPGFDCANYAITTVWRSATLGKEEETTAENNQDLALASQQPGDLGRKVPAPSQGHFLSVPQLLPVSKDFEISVVFRNYLITRSRNPLRLAQIMWELIIRLLKIPETPPKHRKLAWPCGTWQAMEPRTWALLLSPFSLLSLSLSPSPLPSSLWPGSCSSLNNSQEMQPQSATPL